MHLERKCYFTKYSGIENSHPDKGEVELIAKSNCSANE